MLSRITIVTLIAALALCGGLFAQGVQTATLRGRATLESGEPTPGVQVTVQSPALQGERTTLTSETGEYILRGLPAGFYTITFSLEGMDPVEEQRQLEVGKQARVDAAMGLSVLTETVVVQATDSSPLGTSELSYNLAQAQIDELAVVRDLDAIADLAPGVTLNSPNTDQIVINGSYAYDNVWLMNGVDINDNLFGSFDDLFIEDAILETQVLTSGISAEYGRFSGGVVNVQTKSGGNEYHGSLRADLTNNSWREETPFEVENEIERTDKTNDIWQATIGGRILTDRLWFFGAGRLRDTSDTDNFDVTGIGFDQQTENTRYEIKLSGNINDSHTLTASYMENDLQQLRKSFDFSIDPATVYQSDVPNDLKVLRYNGVINNQIFVDAQYSEKIQETSRGGASTDIVDSPMLAFGIVLPVPFGQFNAPYFDANDPESRNNELLGASASFFQTSDNWGSHDIKVGVEDFTATGIGGNSQTATDYVWLADYNIDADGQPTLDAEGRLEPVFFPFGTLINQWIASRGAKIDTTTQSIYVNDRWQLGNRWSFNLGARYERVNSEATNNIQAIDTDRLVPRLGLTYDVLGNGRYTIDASYGQYSGGYNQNIVSANSNVGNPDLVQWLYLGPPGVGRGFSTGFDLDNYVPIFARFNSVNVFAEDGLKSPVVDEFTLGFGMRLPRSGYLQATYVDRDWGDVIEDFITFDQGQTEITDPIPITVDNIVLRNTGETTRTYKAIQLLGRYNITDRFFVQGNYTYTLENDGNFAGEATNQPGLFSSDIGDFPEVTNLDRQAPVGRLPGYQEHKVRVWSNYTFQFGRFGDLGVGLLGSYDSALPYSFAAAGVPYGDPQIARDPGYAFDFSSNTINTVFFGGRGTQEFNDYWSLDLALRYTLGIGPVDPWLKLEIFNLTNEKDLVVYDTSISANLNGPLDGDGLPTTFTRGATFGQGTATGDYQVPREYRFSIGIQF